ncbi:helix-turn-helix transcriptional regulator [Lactobacillus mulieris]|jgi:DNA-binding helix-turn-helix protein|uniref:Helix-turn-helix transcriptional regulator n=1 Tax=Lactobacillus jensenii TaxID=109790 RepID=A0ABU9FFM0_LACJE|nr:MULTISPECIES: helix-turn-helix transcriptional regulator [Lactobacillus]MCW8072796.1 helix-turn-helix domain-containing protein [Lactobacillus mulieris]MDK6268394.1 helix-turn-helix transcriptional regulator [Lactobacillus mulieris]MDT9545029.1 helix-turn-helix transcriptional regulator [Lactobacillus jensenii]
MSEKLLQNVKNIAKENGLSIEQIGLGAGIGEKSIYRWDKVEPKLKTIIKVADFLGIDYKKLLP